MHQIRPYLARHEGASEECLLQYIRLLAASDTGLATPIPGSAWEAKVCRMLYRACGGIINYL
jgi:hypothetical protein